MSTLPDRIREAAELAGGIARLAKKAEIPVSTLNEYLSGSKLPFDRAIAIAAAADVSLDWLATGEGEARWRPGRTADELAGVHRPRLREPAPDRGTSRSVPAIPIPGLKDRPLKMGPMLGAVALAEELASRSGSALAPGLKVAMIAGIYWFIEATGADESEARSYAQQLAALLDTPPG